MPEAGATVVVRTTGLLEPTVTELGAIVIVVAVGVRVVTVKVTGVDVEAA